MPTRKSRASDITAYARIRNAALKLFGERGASATSVRAIAKAAGVSPGLVQHNFKTKAELQEVLEEYVLEKVVELAKICLAQSNHPGEFVIGRLIAGFVQSNADGINYARRAMLEDGAFGRRLFDQVILSCRLLMEQVMNRHLDRPLRTDEGLARWDVACNDLLGQGYYSAETQKATKKRALNPSRPTRHSIKAPAHRKQ
jgi:AcrR family transcriptional regulator